MKIMFTVFLICMTSNVYAHGSSHRHTMREREDMYGNTYLKCHDRILSLAPIIKLHFSRARWHLFSDNEYYEVEVEPDKIISHQEYLELYDEFIAGGRDCANYNKYHF
jgi:hypothetical protein